MIFVIGQLAHTRRELEEYQSEDGCAVFGSLEVGVGTEVVGGGPEVVFELLSWSRVICG